MLGLHSRTCERAREWASLRLDGELSEFERAQLGAHLEGCTSCSTYAERVSRATAALREAALVPVGAPVALPAHRRSRLPLRVYQLGAATAVLAAAVGLGSILGAHASQSDTPAVVSSGLTESVTEDALIRGPRLAMINAGKGLGTQRGIGIVDI